MKIKNIDYGTYDLMEAVQVEYTDGTKIILFNSDKDKLKQIYDTDIKELSDIKHLKIKNYNYIVNRG